jgi:hypothetical protein
MQGRWGDVATLLKGGTKGLSSRMHHGTGPSLYGGRDIATLWPTMVTGCWVTVATVMQQTDRKRRGLQFKVVLQSTLTWIQGNVASVLRNVVLVTASSITKTMTTGMTTTATVAARARDATCLELLICIFFFFFSFSTYYYTNVYIRSIRHVRTGCGQKICFFFFAGKTCHQQQTETGLETRRVSSLFHLFLLTTIADCTPPQSANTMTAATAVAAGCNMGSTRDTSWAAGMFFLFVFYYTDVYFRSIQHVRMMMAATTARYDMSLPTDRTGLEKATRLEPQVYFSPVFDYDSWLQWFPIAEYCDSSSNSSSSRVPERRARAAGTFFFLFLFFFYYYTNVYFRSVRHVGTARKKGSKHVRRVSIWSPGKLFLFILLTNYST